MKTFAEHVDETGLTHGQLKRIAWKQVEDAQRLDDSFLPLKAFVIPYFETSGRQIPTKKFTRVRYLESPARGFAKQSSKNGVNFPRYSQASGTGIRAYFPPLFKDRKRTWKKYLGGAEPLFLTEGEKKAAAATARGFPCVGLSGVWNFREPLTKQLIPDFDGTLWQGRFVYICFDSDLMTNKDVRKALMTLSTTLSDQGALPRVVVLGNSAEKVGLDDFLREHGVEAFQDRIDEAIDLTPDAHLTKFNDRYCFVKYPSEIRSKVKIEQSWAVTGREFDAVHPEVMTVFNKATGAPMQHPVAKVWREWPQRDIADHLVFSPNEGLLTPNDLDGFDFNLWKGWGSESKRGPVQVWKKLLEGVCGKRPEVIKHLEQWLAYPIQHPGAKIFTSVFIWGRGQGTGKSSIGKFMQRIYGPSGVELSDDAFMDSYNEWIECSSFACVDDLASEHPKTLKSHLKRLIASEEIAVRRMYRASYQSVNHCNFLFTSNSNTAIPMDESDNRRYFVIQAPSEPAYPEEWFTNTMDSYLRGDGPSFVRYHLERVSLKGFNPRGRAPETEDAEGTINAAAPEIGVYLMDLMRNPEQWLQERHLPMNAELMSGEMLATWAQADLGNHVKRRQVEINASRVLTRIGQSAPLKDGSRPVFYAFKNAEKYKKKKALAKAHFEKLFVL